MVVDMVYTPTCVKENILVWRCEFPVTDIKLLCPHILYFFSFSRYCLILCFPFSRNAAPCWQQCKKQLDQVMRRKQMINKLWLSFCLCVFLHKSIS